MCSILTVILAKSDYLYTANTAYINLKKAENTFEKEAYVISYIKCKLLRNEEIDDYMTNGVFVSVYETTNGYELYFDNYRISIEVYDKQIIDYDIEKV